jgi:tetratricopeptide (TPR) repeat protein
VSETVSGDSIEGYLEQIERLGRELELPADEFALVRTRVRDELIALVREIDERIGALEAVRSEVRPLVERYRAIGRPEPAAGGAEAGEGAGRTGGSGEAAIPRAPARIDHLGSSTYRERGWSALAGGDYERAVTELERALSLDPANHANLSLLAWAYLRVEQREHARPLIDRVLQEDAEHAQARLCRGYLRLQESRFIEAIQSLTAVAREGTDLTAKLYANLYLGIAHAETGMYRDAEVYFLRALELGPNLTEAYWELGRSRQREGRDELALVAWRAGAANRFNPWGEKCQQAADAMERWKQ